MKFEFSLESVLKVRKHEEKLQKQKLAEKLTEKKRLTIQKKKLKEKLQSVIDNADRNEFKNLHNLRRHNGYIQGLHKRMEQLNGSLKTIESAVEKERDKLALVHKKRNIIEKMKDEEYELFLEKVSRLQQKAMDEIASQAHSRS